MPVEGRATAREHSEEFYTCRIAVLVPLLNAAGSSVVVCAASDKWKETAKRRAPQWRGSSSDWGGLRCGGEFLDELLARAELLPYRY